MTETMDERYALLRRTGTIHASADEATSLVAALRRRATKDGLRLVASKPAIQRGMSPSQRRGRPTTINLTADGVHIVAPDAGKDA